MVRAALAAGHTIDFWAVDSQPATWPAPLPPGLTFQYLPARLRRSPAEKLMTFVAALPETCWSVRSEPVLRALAGVASGQYDLAVLDQHCYALHPELEALGLPFVANVHNVESDVVRQMGVGGRRLRTRVHLAVDARKYERMEATALPRAASVVVVSDLDRERLAGLAAARRWKVHPNGVDLAYFDFVDHAEARGAEFLMTATFGYTPNVDAALWLGETVWPAIRQALPDARVRLVGRDVTREVQALHRPEVGFEVVGRVPDVRPYMAAADVFVVPLRMGGGTRLKVLEALASGIPVLGTALAVEGLGVEDGEAVAVASTPAQFAAAAATLLADTARRHRMARLGRDLVERHFGWDAIGRDFQATLAEAVEAIPSAHR
jgi:glycosyltransferase involved in cell wall biosynthesis